MKIVRNIFVGLMIILVLNGCTKSAITVAPTINSTAEQLPQYPIPQVEGTDNPSYPAPVIQITFSPTFTPDPQMGNVVGALLINNSPITNVNLYLAEVITDKTGKDIVAGLDRVNSPSSLTDDKGKFAFINIKPGRYSLILDMVMSQYLMNYPGKEKTIIVQVEQGNEIDLGVLNYDSLPLPNN
jgi:hypothetical protein